MIIIESPTKQLIRFIVNFIFVFLKIGFIYLLSCILFRLIWRHKWDILSLLSSLWDRVHAVASCLWFLCLHVRNIWIALLIDTLKSTHLISHYSGLCDFRVLRELNLQSQVFLLITFPIYNLFMRILSSFFRSTIFRFSWNFFSLDLFNFKFFIFSSCLLQCLTVVHYLSGQWQYWAYSHRQVASGAASTAQWVFEREIFKHVEVIRFEIINWILHKMLVVRELSNCGGWDIIVNCNLCTWSITFRRLKKRISRMR